jgi:N6-adenosine-specific RNA methylase IME4
VKALPRQLPSLRRAQSGKSEARWAEHIIATWRRSVEAIIETGKLLVAAKAALPHGRFEELVAAKLPFGPRTAQALMSIARNPELVKPSNWAALPPSWTTLRELAPLPASEIRTLIVQGTIRADMTGREIANAGKKKARAERERALGSKQVLLPRKRYGVILADPEWRFEPWSRETGLDRAADNHYPTSCTEVIAARDVPSIAANDCALFLWATVPMLPHALVVMAAWGFDYRSHVVWVKERPGRARGTGFWFINEHELLLLGVKGKPPAPAPGAQWISLCQAPIGRHSEKPEAVSRMIEAYFPTLPKIELNCRGVPRPGWDVWGYEAVEAAE